MNTLALNILKTFMLAASFAMFIAAAQVAQGRELKMVEVPVVTAPVKRGAIISSSDITFAKVDERKVRANTFQTADEIVGKEATRNLRMNYPVHSYMVKVPALFKRGATVNVVFQKGAIRLFAEGTAMQDGNVGDWVRIKNTESGSMLRGLVQENGAVSVN